MSAWFENIVEILTHQIKVIDAYHFTVMQVIVSLLLYVVVRGINYLVKRVILKQERRENIEIGKGFAIYKIFKYLTYTICMMIILEVMGVKVTILLAGSAALLVGVGLGIQQIFNDVFSGILLLFEGTISVGDVVEADGVVGKVVRIDIRTSVLRTRDDITIIIPNSRVIGQNVINWTHNRNATRFNIEIGVAYGSDLQLVKKLLLEALSEQGKIENEPSPFVRFEDFGDSALQFTLYFWIDQVENMFRVENIKSDIRFEIDRLFRENNVTIPFPQRDVHLKR